MDTTELFGYLAMTFLVVSFLPTQVRKVRMINLIACALFIVYGVLLGFKWPLIISNAVVCIIQIYHLFLGNRKTELYGSSCNHGRDAQLPHPAGNFLQYLIWRFFKLSGGRFPVDGVDHHLARPKLSDEP